MVTFEQLGIKYGAFEVPENSIGFELAGDGIKYNQDISYESPAGMYITELPNGRHEVIGLLSEMTEDQAMRMCDVTHIGQWRDYQYAKTSFDPCNEYQECFLSALESLHSRLLALALSPTKPILILKINL